MNRFIKWNIAVLMLLVLISLVGCKPEGATADNSESYTVTDIQGTKVTIPAKPKRILTMSMSTDEMMLGLVEPERMVAVNSLLDDPSSSNMVELGKQVPTKIK